MFTKYATKIGGDNERERERESKPLRRFVTTFFLILSLLLQNFLFLVNPVYAATSPWTQTDWVGGSGQTSWSDNTKFDSSSSVTTSTAGQATLASSWYNTSWAYRVKVTVLATKVDADLTDYPIYVNLANLPAGFHTNVNQTDARDIRVTTSDGTTEVPREVLSYTAATDTGELHFKGTVDGDTNTDFYIYYGNASATEPAIDATYGAENVWDSNYKLVQHLKEDPSGSAPQMLDSTSNDNDGTSAGTMLSEDSVGGQVGNALDFDGSNDYVDMGTDSSINPTDIISFGGWFYINPTAAGNNGAIVHLITTTRVVTPTGGYLMAFEDRPGLGTNKIFVTITNGDGTYTQPDLDNAISSAGWYHLLATYNKDAGGTDEVKLYINGSLVATGDYSKTIGVSPSGLKIGGSSTVCEYFNGIIDDVRISSTARSAEWISTEYNNQSSPATFYDVGSEEQIYSSTPGTLTSSIFDTEFAAGAAWGTLTYNATTPANTSVSVKARTSNSSSMTGATAFSSCDAITSASDISSNNCVTDSHRYIQYQLSLANTDSVSTPTFQDVSIAFSTYDADAPSISLTALSPDPNSDNTPSLSGTATESIGTVSNVQFQMDSTSGSWTACTADDGSF